MPNQDVVRLRVPIKLWGMGVFYLALIVIALRHLALEGDHLWTGEGARMSWSMRLRGKVCEHRIKFSEAQAWEAPNFTGLSFIQASQLDDPLFILQFVQQKYCKEKGKVFYGVACRAIGTLPAPLIDSSTDLCKAQYQSWSHNSWIYSDPGFRDPRYLEWFYRRNFADEQAQGSEGEKK